MATEQSTPIKLLELDFESGVVEISIYNLLKNSEEGVMNIAKMFLHRIDIAPTFYTTTPVHTFQTSIFVLNSALEIQNFNRGKNLILLKIYLKLFKTSATCMLWKMLVLSDMGKNNHVVYNYPPFSLFLI